MERFVSLVGIAAPLLEDDVNTDQIAPVHRDLEPDFAALLFARRRRRADDSEDPDFVLNQPQFRGARILVTGENFGCGSSRESAVWAMMAFGIRCVVARSFADTYRDNCLKNGLLPVSLDEPDAGRLEHALVALDGREPVTVDLVSETITAAGSTWAFSLAPSERRALLEGLDDIGLSLQHAPEITAFEHALGGSLPWLQHALPHQ